MTVIDRGPHHPTSGEGERAHPGWRRVLPLLIKITAILGFAIGLSYFVDFSELYVSLASVSWLTFVAANVLLLGRNLLIGFRWRLLIPHSSGIGFWTSFRLIWASGAAGIFLPGLFGADLTLVLLVSRVTQSNRGGVILSLVLDRMIGLASILLIGIVAYALTPELPGRWFYAGSLAAILVILGGGIWIATKPALYAALLARLTGLGRIGSWIAEKSRELRGVVEIRNFTRNRILAGFAISLLIHFLWFLMVYLVALDLDSGASFFAITAVTTVVWVVSLVPISIGGIGVRELGFVLLLTMKGVSQADAATLAVFQSAMILEFAVLGFPLLWFGWGERVEREHTASSGG